MKYQPLNSKFTSKHIEDALQNESKSLKELLSLHQQQIDGLTAAVRALTEGLNAVTASINTLNQVIKK